MVCISISLRVHLKRPLSCLCIDIFLSSEKVLGTKMSDILPITLQYLLLLFLLYTERKLIRGHDGKTELERTKIHNFSLILLK